MSHAVTYDPTADAFEAWTVDASGTRQWLGAFSTRAEAVAAEAAAEGARAWREGRPVIWIHGRPFADPGADPVPETTAPESPWPWDVWDDGRPDEGQP